MSANASNEDDLQIFKLKYLSIHLSDLTQIGNLSLGDQAKIYICFKWRQPPMLDEPKIFEFNISATTGRILFKF